MKTPYGKECKFYYDDYARGHATQECRLLANNPEAEKWFPALCQTCPVPDILRVNQCPQLHLYARVGKTLFGLSKKVVVEGFCERYFLETHDLRAGCGHCHELDLEEFEIADS